MLATLGVVSLIGFVLLISIIMHTFKFEASRTNASWQNKHEERKHKDVWLYQHPEFYI